MTLKTVIFPHKMRYLCVAFVSVVFWLVAAVFVWLGCPMCSGAAPTQQPPPQPRLVALSTPVDETSLTAPFLIVHYMRVAMCWGVPVAALIGTVLFSFWCGRMSIHAMKKKDETSA